MYEWIWKELRQWIFIIKPYKYLCAALHYSRSVWDYLNSTLLLFIRNVVCDVMMVAEKAWIIDLNYGSLEQLITVQYIPGLCVC